MENLIDWKKDAPLVDDGAWRRDGKDPYDGVIPAGELPDYIMKPKTYGWIGAEAGKYFAELAKKFNSYLMEEKGIALDFSDLEIGEMAPKYAPSGEGKILGEYSPDTKDIALSSDLPKEYIRSVLAHEMAHYVQDKLGMIDDCIYNHGEKEARPIIEGGANQMCREVLGCTYLI